MPEYPDVLDLLGKTPREFGSVHVHVEPIQVDKGWGWTTVWAQTAWEPADPHATVEVLTWDEPREVLLPQQPLPALNGGRVAKGTVRFRLPADVSNVAVVVHSGVTRGAVRYRPAWKLFDTIAAPKQNDGKPSSAKVAGDVVSSLLNAPSAFLGMFRAESKPAVEVPRKRERPLAVEVMRGPSQPAPAPGFSTFWELGQSLPEPEMLLPPGAPEAASNKRECSRCGFSARREDFESDLFCPTCGYEWPALDTLE